MPPILEDADIDVVDSPTDRMESVGDSNAEDLLKNYYGVFLDEMNLSDLKKFVKRNTRQWIELRCRLEKQNATINKLKRQLEQIKLNLETDPVAAKKSRKCQNGCSEKSPHADHNYALTNSPRDVIFSKDNLEDWSKNIFNDLFSPTKRDSLALDPAVTSTGTLAKDARDTEIAKAFPVDNHPEDIQMAKPTPPRPRENTNVAERLPDKDTIIDLTESSDDEVAETPQTPTVQAAKVTSSTDTAAGDQLRTQQAASRGCTLTRLSDAGQRPRRSLGGIPLGPRLPLIPPPPRPRAAAFRFQDSIIVSWYMEFSRERHAPPCSFEIFATYQTARGWAVSRWKLVGSVVALPLPMAVVLTDFDASTRYVFVVRAVDTYQRRGPFSVACTWRAANQ